METQWGIGPWMTLTSCKIFCKCLSLCHCRRPKQISKWKACRWSMVFCSKIQRVRPSDRTKKRLPSHISGKLWENSANRRNVIQWKMPTVTSGLCACVRSIPCRGCLVRYPLLIVNQSWLNNLTKHIGHASAWCSQCVLKVALHPSNLSPAKAWETRCQTITQASTIIWLHPHQHHVCFLGKKCWSVVDHYPEWLL